MDKYYAKVLPYGSLQGEDPEVNQMFRKYSEKCMVFKEIEQPYISGSVYTNDTLRNDNELDLCPADRFFYAGELEFLRKIPAISIDNDLFEME